MQDNDHYPVVAVERAQMDAWGELLREQGITATQWLPDVLALPTAEEGWSLLVDADSVLVRNGEYAGFVADLENFYTLFALFQAQEQVREFGQTATSQMTARHKDEVSALNHEFDSQISELKLNSGEATSAEMHERRREINQQREEARAELQDRQKDEKKKLAKDIRDSNTKVAQFIDDAERAEEKSLLRQLGQKLAYLKRHFQAVVRGPMSGSVESQLDIQPFGEIRDLTGQATVIRTDGSREDARTGLEIYQGDIRVVQKRD